MSSKRPEHLGPPELYYNDTEARKYATNSHIIAIQNEMSERALELLALPEGKECLLLDIGCGSGLSGEVLTEHGYQWIGMDISEHMLKIAKDDTECEGDLILQDMGNGVPFRPGIFDGAISISALQWLCHSNKNDENPKKRLLNFFQTLYGALNRGSRAVFQFYTENTAQTDLVMQQATTAGFNGGIVVDYPNSTKARKMYLVLMTGGIQTLPRALTDEQKESSHVSNLKRKQWVTGREKAAKPKKGSKAWIMMKKERMQKQGKEVRPNTKYTGRKRNHGF